jgi:hypothetical protein
MPFHVCAKLGRPFLVHVQGQTVQLFTNLQTFICHNLVSQEYCVTAGPNAFLKYHGFPFYTFANHVVWYSCIHGFCVHAEKQLFLHQEIHICWRRGCNRIWNQFYALHITIVVRHFMTCILYLTFFNHIIIYVLCLVKEEATYFLMSVNSGCSSSNP